MLLHAASSARPAAGCLRQSHAAQPLTWAPAIGTPQALRSAAAHGRRRSGAAAPPQAILDWFKRAAPQPVDTAAAQLEQQRQAAVARLLAAIEGSERGLATQRQPAKAEIMAAVDELAELGEDSATTDAATLSATWRLLWTTEKETLFILQNARWFGTAAGDVFQVVDVEAGTLQNVITFPPEGAFVVDSSISVAGPQRTSFAFTGATLQLPAGRRLSLPPFGSGWFDSVYADGDIRVARDSRGDTLVVARDGPPRRF